MGIGECALFEGLSYDDVPEYEKTLQWTVDHIGEGKDFLMGKLKDFPSIKFGVEQAFLSLESRQPFVLFSTSFTNAGSGIPINGLIWMGNIEEMKRRIKEKIESGYRVLKLKIGAFKFEEELRLIKEIRREFSAGDMEIRLDANGAFGREDVMDKLEGLAAYGMHSIEQPVKAGQWDLMSEVCKKSPIPVALDEELIGLVEPEQRIRMMQRIAPDYIILKPSLIGGYEDTLHWINLAESFGAGWWITSALESNIGLNAIAQFTASMHPSIPQGLGTGELFTNNIISPLKVIKDKLYYLPEKNWELDRLKM